VALVLPSGAWADEEELRLALESRLLFRDPSQGLIGESEIERLPLNQEQKDLANRHREAFALKVPLDGSRVYWIDRFHRDLYRALLLKKSPKEDQETFHAVQTHYGVNFGHQSQVFLRPDGLPFPNSTSSPYLEADLSLLLQSRELPGYGAILVEFSGNRRDMERKSLSAFDTQTMGVAISFKRAMDQLKMDVEQSFFGSSASRPGALDLTLSWERKRDFSSAFMNGTLTSEFLISHQSFTGQLTFDQLGKRKDASTVEFGLDLESLPFQLFGGKSFWSMGSSMIRQSSKSSALDRFGVEPRLGLDWKEPRGTYEFETHLGYLAFLSQSDFVGSRNDRLLSWAGTLCRNMSEIWALQGGWELQRMDSDQSIYNHQNDLIFLGLNGRL